jgi:uncharacterized OB-fold protein
MLKMNSAWLYMPLRIICEKCGSVLYEGVDLKPPDEVVQQCGGKCPKCGKKLLLIPSYVEVKPTK